ncbi:32385_t:CDS:2 [Gigaspora margarita]|uniref:32385_t:CDS:1 n=1 Tax=Gigaspora margarita TaxID=4874 RepID=A0ABN7U3T3_GIGMA|nr:32385_t:CDS:2 [Gigaspora margarita]
MKHNQKSISVKSDRRNFELMDSTRFKNPLESDRKLNLIEYATKRFSDKKGSNFDLEIKVDNNGNNNCASNNGIEIDAPKDKESTIYTWAFGLENAITIWMVLTRDE